MPTHLTLSGQEIEYPTPSPPLAKFLKRLEAMAEDSSVTENELIGVAYGSENPLLDHSLFPERGAVTKEVLAHPAYQVMTDLLARKRVQQDKVDITKLAAEFTIPLPQAAKEIGVTPSALQQAIWTRRLRAWVKTGPKGKPDYYLKPESLHTFGVTRGPRKPPAAEPLEVRIGHSPGNMLEIKHPGDLDDRKKVGHAIIEGRIPRWQRVAFRYGGGKNQKPRLAIIGPAAEDNEFTWGDEFWIRGKFEFVKRANNLKEVADLWEEFRPS